VPARTLGLVNASRFLPSWPASRMSEVQIVGAIRPMYHELFAEISVSLAA
jgi:hypothetical protein